MAFWKHIGRIRAQRENAASIGLQKGEKRVGQTERGMEGICRSSRKGAAAAKCVICEKVA